MADDKGTSQLFGESLPGTGGDYLDTNDVEGHMGNKHITPMPPSADGGPDGIGGKGRSPIPEIDGSDTEGHRKGPGGNIPNLDAGPEGIGGKGRSPIPEADGSDTEGHRKGPGGNIPNVDGSPDDFSNKRLFRDFDGGTDDDVEGHRKGPGGNIPNVDGSPDDFSNKRLFRDFDGGTDDDVEGHGFAKRAPGENPHGDR